MNQPRLHAQSARVTSARSGSKTASALIFLLFASGSASAQEAIGKSGTQTIASATLVDATGLMHMPPNYRNTYQYLGTWAVAADGKGSSQLHVVYASPGAVASYRAKGRFADGDVLVKEVFVAKTGDMTTGTVSRADKLEGWFLMVKDSRNSYPANKQWGEGWGWAWFNEATPNTAKTVDYKKECLGCHVPAKANDWSYIEGYPVLRH